MVNRRLLIHSTISVLMKFRKIKDKNKSSLENSDYKID
jgi:hypothetical protein